MLWSHLPLNQGIGTSPSSDWDTWAGTPSTVPSCSKPQCPTCPGTLPGMEWPQLLGATCARASSSSQGTIPSENLSDLLHSLEPGWLCSSAALPALSSLCRAGGVPPVQHPLRQQQLCAVPDTSLWQQLHGAVQPKSPNQCTHSTGPALQLWGCTGPAGQPHRAPS